MHHVEVVSLMLNQSKKKKKKPAKKIPITMHVIPLDRTGIRQDGRKRVPSLGKRIGKFFRKHSSRVTRKPSMFRRLKSTSRSVDGTSHSFSSSSGTPSPKLPLSPRRAESMKDPVRPIRQSSSSSKWKQPPPVSPLARSTSPGPLSSSMITSNTSLNASNENLSSTTPPGSPSKQDRHSFLESNLLTHKKSISTSELLFTGSKKSTSPQTSPLLKRAVSPSPEQPYRVTKPRRSSTLERSTNIRSRNRHTPEEETNPLTLI